MRTTPTLLASLAIAAACLAGSSEASAQEPAQPPPPPPPAGAQPPPPPAAPPTKSAEDVESSRPTAGAGAGGASDKEAPWYEHKPWMSRDPVEVPPPKPPKPVFFPLSAIYDVHSFVAGNVIGAGSLIRAAIGVPGATQVLDFTIGAYVGPAAALHAGMSLGRSMRYSFIPPLVRTDDLTLTISSGHAEFGVSLLNDIPVTMNVNGSLLGLRAAHCGTHLFVDARPVAGFWAAPAAEAVAFSWGASINLGVFFSWVPEKAKPKPVEEEEKPKEKKQEEEEEARIKTQRCYL